MISAKKTKVVRVIARLNVGGPAKHVVWLTQGLQNSSFETVLVAGTVPDGEEAMDYFATEMGVKPYYIPQMSREISVQDAITIWKLFRLFLRERPEIIHTHTAKAGTVGRIAGFFYRWLTPRTLIGQPRRCKFVHTYHGHIFHSYYSSLRTGFFLFIERFLARAVTDRLLVVSAQQKKEINLDFRVGRPDQFAIVPLGLDLTAYENGISRRPILRRELQVTNDTVLVGIVGRLTEIKNHELFLRSIVRFRQLRKRVTPRVKFVVIGDGFLRSHLKDLSESLGLVDDVMFLGSRRDPENFYPALDIVALTSKNEGTPLTLIEAMANARPVIATGVGGVVDLLGEPLPTTENYFECTRGIRVSPNNENAFALGLIRLIEDAGLRTRFAQNGVEFVRSNYTKQRLLDDVKGLYAELLSPELARIKAGSEQRGAASRA